MTGRSPALKRGAAAVVGIGALAGWVLASGAAAPVVEDVVALVSPAPAATPDPATGATVDGQRVKGVADYGSSDGWMDDDNRPQWSTSRLVPSGPTGSDAAQAPSTPSAPQIQVPEDPKGRQFFQDPAKGMRRYTLKPRTSCFQQRGPAMPVQSFGATGGKGQATVTWYDLGDPDTVSYQLDIVRVSDSKAQTQMTVAAPKTCKQVTVTVPNLKRGAAYAFFLTATNKSPEQDGKLYRAGRGETSAVEIS